MKTSRGVMIGAMGFMVGSVLTCSSLAAQTMDYAASAKPAETKYKAPQDLLDMIPFLGELPRTFLFGGGYRMKLSVDSLRIDHMGSGSRSHKASHRNCMIGVSYTTPVAGFFTSRVDLPLFNSPTPKWSDWTRSSLGDYVVYMSREAVEQKSVRLSISAKF